MPMFLPFRLTVVCSCFGGFDIPKHSDMVVSAKMGLMFFPGHEEINNNVR